MYTLHVTLETRVLQNEAVAHVALVKTVHSLIDAFFRHAELLNNRLDIIACTKL